MTGQPDGPNWAEIIGGIGGLGAFLIAMPAVFFFLKDRWRPKPPQLMTVLDGHGMEGELQHCVLRVHPCQTAYGTLVKVIPPKGSQIVRRIMGEYDPNTGEIAPSQWSAPTRALLIDYAFGPSTREDLVVVIGLKSKADTRSWRSRKMSALILDVKFTSPINRSSKQSVPIPRIS